MTPYAESKIDINLPNPRIPSIPMARCINFENRNAKNTIKILIENEAMALTYPKLSRRKINVVKTAGPVIKGTPSGTIAETEFACFRLPGLMMS